MPSVRTIVEFRERLTSGWVEGRWGKKKVHLILDFFLILFLPLGSYLLPQIS